MEEMKQTALLEETETNLNVDYYGQSVTVYSNCAPVCRRLIKKGYKPVDISKANGEIFGMTFKFNFSNWDSSILPKTLFRAKYAEVKSMEN